MRGVAFGTVVVRPRACGGAGGQTICRAPRAATNLGQCAAGGPLRSACAEAAKATAKLILTAADRMEDRFLPRARAASRGGPLGHIFRAEQAAAGILPPQALVRVPGRQIAGGLVSAEPVLA